METVADPGILEGGRGQSWLLSFGVGMGLGRGLCPLPKLENFHTLNEWCSGLCGEASYLEKRLTIAERGRNGCF